MYTKEQVTKAIDDEPMLEEEMPEELWQLFKQMVKHNDKRGLSEAFRVCVRLTQVGIKERLFGKEEG